MRSRHRPGGPVEIVTIGAAASANKGAAGMLEAVLRHLPEHAGPCRFRVLTTHPGADRARLLATDLGADVEVLPLRPVDLLMSWPLALLGRVARRLGRSPRRWHRTPALRAIADADVVVDLAGVSFVDDRPPAILAYNVLMTALPLVVGVPVVKAAQAVGPFRRPVNRLAAQLVLPRLAGVVARGAVTRSHLEALPLDPAQIADGTDLAFLLPVGPAAEQRVDELLARSDVAEPVAAVMPSAVVDGLCRKRGIDYVGAMAEVIRRLVDAGYSVVVAAHSAEPGAPSRRMNDLPLCEATVAAAEAAGVDRQRLHGLLHDLSAAELRALIGRTDLLVTSRFHAMISALATATPVVVVGWSHKYREVLSRFGLEQWMLDYTQLHELDERVDKLCAARDEVAEAITSTLPAVMPETRRSLQLIAEVAGATAEGSGTRQP